MTMRQLRASCIFLLISTSFGALGFGQSTPDQKLRDQLPGAWRLVSIETIKPNGEVSILFTGNTRRGC